MIRGRPWRDPWRAAAVLLGLVAMLAGPAPGAASGPALVTGFRSARFGMTEAQVRAAIRRDFRLGPEAVEEVRNPREGTVALTVAVADLLPGGGRSQLSYLFGYRSRRLIQVGALWSKDTDPGLTPQRLQDNAALLGRHFAEAGYSPGSIILNRPVDGNLVVFRGSDARGRTVLLVLAGAPADAGRTPIRPQSLRLSYVLDFVHPDVMAPPAP